MASKKTSAADRTIDMFSAQLHSPVGFNLPAPEDAVEVEKPAETIEVQAERLRDKAFEFAEHLSKSWGQVIDGGTYRLTTKGQYMLLEQFKHNGKESGAYGYTGVMFPIGDLYELTNVLVKASKEKQERDKR